MNPAHCCTESLLSPPWRGSNALRGIHYVMGTLLDVTLHYDTEVEGKRLLQYCFQEARRLEELLSTHDEESELNRLNAHAGQGPLKIDRDLWSVLDISVRLGRTTEGALDITIGPLIDLWSLAELKGTLPSPDSVSEVLRRTGISRVHLLPDWRGELTEAGMRLDLGGIGKGYAVDRLKGLLAREGVESAFINFGRSSLAALGSPPGRRAWPVLLEGGEGELVGLAHLKDQSLSASGNFGHTYEIGRARYGHLIDPRNGFPLCHPTLGVAVAQTAAEAEALTKALVILGPDQGLPVVTRFSSAEGLLVFSHGQRVSSFGFREAVRFQPAEEALGGYIQ